MHLSPKLLGPKLYLSLLAFMLALCVATSMLMFFAFRRTQSDATRRSEEGLQSQGRDTLFSLATLQAYIGESQLAATSGFGQQAARYMLDLKRSGGGVPWDSSRLVRGSGGQLFDPSASRVTDVFVPSDVPMSDAVERDLRDSAALDAVFPTLVAGFSATSRARNFDAVAMYFDGVSGVTRYYPAVGLADRLRADASTAATMRAAGPVGNPARKTLWTTPYPDKSGQGQIVTARTPIYDGDEFRGVLGVDVSLAQLTAQIDAVRPTASGYAFYVDADGSVLRTAAYDAVQAAMRDTSNTQFANTILSMRKGESGVERMTLDGRDVFVAHAPLADVGGNFALVAPIDEITQQADAVSSSINSAGNRTVGITLAMMLAFFAAAIVSTIWLSRRMLLRPIEALVDGTRAVAAGNEDVTIPVTSRDEFGMRRRCF